jgi:hypothetical protein
MATLTVTARRRIAALLLCALCAVVLAAACAPRTEQTEITIDLPAEVQNGLLLKWRKVPGADSYRMVFKRMTGVAVCTLMVAASKEPSFTIVRDSLPNGLIHGWQLDMEMHAMRKGEPMAAQGFRPLLIP